jgi:hypothetical protein
MATLKLTDADILDVKRLYTGQFPRCGALVWRVRAKP